MELSRFNTDKHYNMLTEWYINHKQNMLPLECLPPIGYVVNNVAAGFVYLTDSNLAIIENFISNPHSTKDDRNKALDLIASQLIQDAKDNGYSILMCLTKLPSVIDRAKSKFDFIDADSGYTVLARRI